MSEPELLLRAQNLHKKFGKISVIEDVTCEIKSNALGLLGPNGSGKTTLIKLMLGLMKPSSGTIELNTPREGLRIISDQPNLPGEMTINDWIRTIEDLHGPLTRNIDIQTNFGLHGEWKLKNLSAGQKRKAAILLAFYGKPNLIILDEPTNFLDIVSRQYILKLLREHIAYTGTRIIIATHRVEEIRLFCDDVLILKEGEVIVTVSMDNQLPQLYIMRVDDVPKMSTYLDDEDVFYFIEESYQGQVLKMQATDAIFNAAAKFTIDGGRIYSFEAEDELKRSIEELLK